MRVYRTRTIKGQVRTWADSKFQFGFSENFIRLE